MIAWLSSRGEFACVAATAAPAPPTTRAAPRPIARRCLIRGSMSLLLVAAGIRAAAPKIRVRVSAERREQHGALSRPVELAEEDPLPCPERETAVPQRDDHLGAHQRRTDVRRRVLLPRLDVLPAPVVADHPLERRLEVARNGRIGVFVDRHPGGRVRDEDEQRRAVAPVGGGPDVVGDVDELRPTLRPDTDLPHLRILRPCRPHPPSMTSSSTASESTASSPTSTRSTTTTSQD